MRSSQRDIPLKFTLKYAAPAARMLAAMALAWGAFFQDPSLTGTLCAGVATLALWLTAKTDERECLAYFGEAYARYMQRTKRFIPYLF